MSTPSMKAKGKGSKARPKKAKEPKQGPIANTGGVFVPKPSPNTGGAPTKIPIVPEGEEEKSFLEKKQQELQKGIDDWVEKQGNNKLAMAGGALATALNQVFFPTSVFELVPAGKVFKLAKKGKEGIETAKKAKQAEKKVQKTQEVKKADTKSGARVDGDDLSGRCKLRTHKQLTDKNSPFKCPKGMDSHHVVANRTFQKAKGRSGNLMKGGVPEEDGLAICLETNKNGPKSEHVLAHKDYDKAEKLLAKNPNSPDGLAKLGELEKKAGDSIEKATNGKCRSEDISKQLRDYHLKKFKLKADTLVRAAKNPNSLAKKALSSIGKSARSTR
jgi:hypothetical protein